MSNPTSNGRAASRLVDLVRSIPAGYVATHGAIARFLAIDQRHVVTMLQSLDDATRVETPWWRVVADGGAIGRHAKRDEQIAGLQADGVPLSPVGIVQEFNDRGIADLAHLPAAPFKTHPTSSNGATARSRGMKSHPGV